MEKARKNSLGIRSRKRGIEGPVAQTVLIFFVLIILLLTLMPLLITMVMSVKSSQDIMAYPIWTLPKSGWFFTNYSEAFSVLSLPMFNTVAIDLISTVVTLLMSCFIAFLFERYKFGGKKLLFFLIFLPMMVPSVILLSPTYIVVVRWMGLENNWFGLILPYIAGNQIASIFLLRVFMRQQPASLYEAAQLDGACVPQIFFYICLPLSVPIMMIHGISIFAAMYNDYLWPLLLYQNDLSSGVLMPYLRSIVDNYAQGIKYAMYLVAGIPLIITTIISIKFFVSGDFASGLKL